MPGAKTRQYLVWFGAIGTFVSCFGCFLGFRNEMNAARAFLILAWLILVPLFIYLIRMRSIASRQYKARVAREEARLQKELAALGMVEGAISGNPPTEEGVGDPVPDR